MTDVGVVQSLNGLSFFHGFEPEPLQRLAEISHTVDYPSRTAIFRENDPAKDVYVIMKGQVSLVICQPTSGCRQLMQVSDGDLVSWSPLVGRRRLSDTAFTLTPTKVMVIDGKRLLDVCREDPEFGFELMHRVAQVLAQRLSATRMKLMELSGFHLPDVPLETD